MFALACAWLAVSAAQAGVLGMLADNEGDRITIFDADSDRVRVTLPAHPGQALGDCAINAAQDLGMSTNSSSRISFIDLSGFNDWPASPMAAPRAESLVISNLGVDMALSPDESFLVAAGGGALSQPLSVVDVRRREEVALSSPFVDHTSVEFCDDGTLLVTTSYGRNYGAGPDNALYDAHLDGLGGIHLLGGRVASGAQPNNSACAPGSRAGVMLDRAGGLTAFRLPDMEATDRAATRDALGVSAVFSPDGRRVYVRTSRTVEAFDFDPVAGTLRAAWVRAASLTSTFYGMDQIAMHPGGGKLYVDGGDVLMVLDPADGTLFGAIQAGDATGVCFANRSAAPPEYAIAAPVGGVIAP